MAIPLNKKKKERKFAQISQKILIQYFASLFGLIGIGLGGFYIAKFICSRKVWYNGDPLYDTLKILEYYFPKIFRMILVLCEQIFAKFAYFLNSKDVILKSLFAKCKYFM